jgi:SulP family sulfate permease
VFKAELTSPKSDVLVLLATFFLTVLVDLTVAIEVGMVLAAFLFMHRMATLTNVSQVTGDLENDEGSDELATVSLPKDVEVYEINGPFFFGAAETFKDTLARVAGKPRVLILRMRRVPVMDATGLHALADVVLRSRRDGTLVLLTEVQSQPREALGKSILLEEIGEEHIHSSFDAAVARAREELQAREMLTEGGKRGAAA